ncbi:hypothetical protein CBM2634_A10236 [Cupriavidus taiwanensis]|uniref:Uncharacterized protein n=1 Tax=Cupriavidus taiwanensis TaxID=164546 RepID=A0A375IXC7_9BURK|nr:hypothetical protein CBM2634_A10236 [Cupriavidus taiwanensis]
MAHLLGVMDGRLALVVLASVVAMRGAPRLYLQTWGDRREIKLLGACHHVATIFCLT